MPRLIFVGNKDGLMKYLDFVRQVHEIARKYNLTVEKVFDDFSGFTLI